MKNYMLLKDYQPSISSTINAPVFCTNVFFSSYVLALNEHLYKKTLMKLTPGFLFLQFCHFWLQIDDQHVFSSGQKMGSSRFFSSRARVGPVFLAFTNKISIRIRLLSRNCPTAPQAKFLAMPLRF